MPLPTLNSRPTKVGRNAPCPCGSGTKFKKCCLRKMEPKSRPAPPAVMEKARVMFQKKMEAERKRVERYGEVYPIRSTVNFGKRLVPVGNAIYATDIQNYVSDFLRDYVDTVFGSEWFRDEAAKPEAKRHLIVQWRSESNRYMSTQPMQLDGSRRGVPSGITAAFIAFAYDLYIVADHDGLDDLFLKRLKNHELFQGARHELFAEATCLRGGFSIEREDEQDGNSRHAEFTALHRATGQKLSVEAKSKHRPGVLGRPGVPEPFDRLSLRFGKLINEAIRKNSPHPLVIFFDTNLPFGAGDRLLARQPGGVPSQHMKKLLAQIKKDHGGKDPYSMIVFSNHPHHYAAKDEKDPQKHLLSVESDDSLANSTALWSLHKAALLYGNVPNEFPPNN
jgi:hypothetical protein